jgi:serine/threonine protein phosphatase PrpC
LALDAKYQQEFQEESQDQGSTCVLALVTPFNDNHGLSESAKKSSFANSPYSDAKFSVLVAYCGDSRCLMLGKGKYKPITVDHKPDAKGELKRIETAGSYVLSSRVKGVLGVSRAFGDFKYKTASELAPKYQSVTALPDTISVCMGENDHYLFLACDGVFEQMSSEEVATFLLERLYTSEEGKEATDPRTSRHPDLGTVLDELLSESLERGSKDNMTAMLIRVGQCGTHTSSTSGSIPANPAGSTKKTLSRTSTVKLTGAPGHHSTAQSSSKCTWVLLLLLLCSIALNIFLFGMLNKNSDEKEL